MITESTNKGFLFATIILFSLVGSTRVQGQVACEIDNDALQAMPSIDITLMKADGNYYSISAKLADNDVTRAAGFQRVCESTIEAMPILFVFERQVIPSFHMNNVVAPIDIAFIDKRGRIESIQAMKPYNQLLVEKPLYSPKRPVLYALEVHKNFFQKHKISVGSSVSWATASTAE